MTKAVRIIGIGSPVAGDEIAIQLVRQLRRDALWQKREEIEWLELERPGAALLHYFAGVETLCLIDTLKSGVHSGIVRLQTEDLLGEEAAISSHHFGLAEALHLATALGQLPPRLLIYGVVPSADNERTLSAMLQHDLVTESAVLPS